MEREYNYDNVYLVPQKCIVNSRSDCDIGVRLGKRTFRNPVIAANMKSVVNFDTCEYLARKGMFYIMHRFDLDIEELMRFINKMKDGGFFASISVGVNEDDRDLIDFLAKTKCVPDYVTIDVAHAHSDKVADTIKHIKDKMSETFVIAGNVATAEAVEFLEAAGSDCEKLFIAPGKVCTTKVKTGFTRGTITCLLECAKIAKNPLIADGGIKEVGHIVKAIACGATMVMCGHLMCGYDQNSGQMVLIEGEKKYIYYGSASFNIKQCNRHIEGTEILVDYKGDMDDIIEDIECSLKSAVSYSGKNRLVDIYGTPMFYM